MANEIIIADVSVYNDVPATAFKPDVNKLVQAGITGIIVRLGYGRVKDKMFDHFWTTSKGKLERGHYWYLDYYSHKKMNPVISDVAWGTEQGANLANWTKADRGEMPAVIDCEESPYGWRLDWTNRSAYNTILKACIAEYARLTGKIPMLYFSPGFIANIADSLRDMNLWVAWYNRTITKQQVIDYTRSKGWRGPIKIWQFASNGDLDGDGIADGLALGMETKNLDLNVWMGTVEGWSKFCGNTPPPVPPTPVEDPVVTEPLPTYGQTKIIELKTVKVVSGLNIRSAPVAGTTSNIVGWLANGQVVECLDYIVINGNTWARVGQKQYCAVKYNGIVYME